MDDTKPSEISGQSRDFNKEFYSDASDKHRCTTCNKTFTSLQDLKDHKTRFNHKDDRTPKHTTTVVQDAKLAKRKEMKKKTDTCAMGQRKG